MAITVGEFYEDLRVVIARGNTTDERVRFWSRNALRFLEREFTFDYMRASFFLLMLPGAKYFNFQSQTPPIPLKEIEHLGFYGSDGGMIGFNRRNINSMGMQAGSVVSTYRVAGTKIFFEGNTTPTGLTTETVSYPILLHTGIYTEWPSDENESHPVLEAAEDLMKYQVLLGSTPSLRKQSELQGWKFMRDEAITSIRRLEDSKELEDDVRMIYRGGHEGNLFASTSAAIAAIAGMFDVPDTFGIAGLYYVGLPHGEA